MTAAVTCRTCGGAPRAGARFCDACGAPIAASKPSAEYKQVTVLFADVVRSMDIAAAEGSERLREIMAELLDRSTAVVKRYGGTLSQFTGDGIMAVFGAPVTLEDHAFRACMAALGIQKEVETTLKLRIGLNSSQVIAGEIGSSTGGYTTIGEQVGMAQRMESVASPGDVMLSESTARLVENTVVLGEPEQVHIKNVDTPVRARRLLALGEHQPSHRSESKLVGRTWELNTVTGILEAINGAGCVSTSWGRRASGRAAWSAKPSLSPLAFLCRCSPAIELSRAVLEEEVDGGGVIFGPMATSVLVEAFAAGNRPRYPGGTVGD